jgi:hypothetical protein
VRVARYEKEDYVNFDCPGCGQFHVLPIKGPNAWGFNGNYDRPTLTPSILANRGRANPTAHICHSYVTDGRIQFLGDCTHELANQTVDLPEIKEAE